MGKTTYNFANFKKSQLVELVLILLFWHSRLCDVGEKKNPYGGIF